MSEVERRTIAQTPLNRLGDIPPEALLDFLAGQSRRIQSALLAKWSAQLSPKGLQ